MKVLIVYDTVSPLRCTEKVAQSIEGVLKEMEVEVDSFFVKDVNVAVVKDYDCLIAGAPTMAFRASNDMRKFLESLSGMDFSGKLAAAFDTQVQSRFSGSAVKGIEGKLKKLGFKLFTTPLVAYVEGKMNAYHLKEGELEKAKKWAQNVAETLKSKTL
ncbi:MAG: flavodoxin family protein [Candidatus Bathycorpusculaceae bacterium]